MGFSWRDPERTTAAPGLSAKPGVPRLDEDEVGAGEGTELLSLGVLGADGVPESELKVNIEEVDVGGLGRGNVSVLTWGARGDRGDKGDKVSFSTSDIFAEAVAKAASVNPFPFPSLAFGDMGNGAG